MDALWTPEVTRGRSPKTVGTTLSTTRKTTTGATCAHVCERTWVPTSVPVCRLCDLPKAWRMRVVT
jgi:hypothetical protein